MISVFFLRRSVASVTWISLFTICGCGGNAQRGDGEQSFSAQFRKASQLPNAERRAQRLIQLAIKQDTAGDTSGARRSLEFAQRSCDEIQDPLGRAKATNNLAAAQAKTRLRSQAGDSLKTVESLVDDVSDVESRIAILTKAAHTYGSELSNKRRSMSLLSKSEKLVESMDDARSQTRALCRLAYANYLLGSRDEADTFLEHAVQSRDEISDLRQRSDTTAYVAAMCQRMENTELASKLFDDAIHLARSITDSVSKAHGLVELADKLSDAKLRSQAMQILNEAETAADSIQDRGLRTEVLEKIATQRSSTSQS
jgi:tetratricopeptide (TPR) repeat protein